MRVTDLRLQLIGFGTVGQALGRALIASSLPVQLVSVTDRQGTVADPRGLDPAAVLAQKARQGAVAPGGADARWAIDHVGADVVAFLIPTDLREARTALELALAALRRGKGVVLAEKGALALHGTQLRAEAMRAGVPLRASATVCGGTPVLELLKGAFHGDQLQSFDAVLNGSTNFVLSRLEEGVEWEAALAAARAMGVLEEDPSLDLLGSDAGAKAVILANVAWGTDHTLADASVRGIMGVTGREAREAKAAGLAIRLVARGSRERGVSVAPVALPRDHALVTESLENAVRLKFRDAGVITLRGPGAGGRETAAAVLSDILSMGRGATPPRAPLLTPP